MRRLSALNSPAGGFSPRRQRSSAFIAVALIAYAWLVFQAVLPLIQSWRDTHRHAESDLVSSRIEMPAEQVRHCMHHTDMACPPNCHCPQEIGLSHDSEAAEGGVKNQADLLTGETCYRPCTSGTAMAWEMGGMPLHVLSLTETLMLWGSDTKLIDRAFSLWVGFSPEAPDKVPILSA